ncbi:hypothetical protein BJX96DRAFT_175133 [Aspergillus floccosus]
MPESIIKLLKKSKDTKPQKPLDDSMSEVTIIEQPTYYIVRQTTQQNQQSFNPADMCFGSCCRK